MLLNVFRLEC